MTEQFHFFWRTNSPFSQWHPSNFVVEGQPFNCAEQYMMWGKAQLFGDAEIAAQILEAAQPRDQKALGRKVRNFDRTVWSKHAREIVYRGNRAKFTQNPDLRKFLLATGDATIVEAAPNDAIWGIGISEEEARTTDPSAWPGTNWLGEILTKLREELKNEG
ncbi:MAG: NADAR family protein [Bacteroidota bacterium]